VFVVVEYELGSKDFFLALCGCVRMCELLSNHESPAC
jgi:hypothetical protein